LLEKMRDLRTFVQKAQRESHVLSLIEDGKLEEADFHWKEYKIVLSWTTLFDSLKNQFQSPSTQDWLFKVASNNTMGPFNIEAAAQAMIGEMIKSEALEGQIKKEALRHWSTMIRRELYEPSILEGGGVVALEKHLMPLFSIVDEAYIENAGGTFDHAWSAIEMEWATRWLLECPFVKNRQGWALHNKIWGIAANRLMKSRESTVQDYCEDIIQMWFNTEGESKQPYVGYLKLACAMERIGDERLRRSIIESGNCEIYLMCIEKGLFLKRGNRGNGVDESLPGENKVLAWVLERDPGLKEKVWEKLPKTKGRMEKLKLLGAMESEKKTSKRSAL
jgi:hypothetical protein